MKDQCWLAYESYIKRFSEKVFEKRVLDVGCGNGNYTALFCKDGNTVHGIDIKDLRENEYKDNFIFAQYNGIKFPFKDHTFDVVISFDVIEHVEKDLKFVKEIKRVLSKNGKILIATPNRNRLSNVILKLIGKPRTYPWILSESSSLGKLVHIREYTKSELLNLFKNAGFEQIYIDNFWFGLRGNINIGINKFFINEMNQYLFLRNFPENV